MKIRLIWPALIATLAMPSAYGADVDAPTPETVAIHGQLTWTEQEAGGFTAPYAGPNSLHPHQGRETVDATLYAGARLTPSIEGWINLEIDQGFGLDNTLGVAGFPSGEAYKVGKKRPYLRLPRAFVRDTIELGDTTEAVNSQANQLAGRHATDRWVFTLGKFGVTDIFDASRYAHDPRNDFLNWTAVDAGSFDYAADAWGFSTGLAVERYAGAWTSRVGLFDLSTLPNSEHLTPGFRQYQWIGELEHRHRWNGHDGKWLATVYDSHARMGRLQDAITWAQTVGGSPDVAMVRRPGNRVGGSVLIEQAFSDDVGGFLRAGSATGTVEAYEFTDVDRSLELGASVVGSRWGRPLDTVGLAVMRNGISAARTAYLAAGGLGILVGDGQLTHSGPESILEAYYAVAAFSGTTVTLDLQRINHIAYNEDRGPVTVAAIRVHAQF